MNDVRELFPESEELKLIDPRRTSIILVEGRREKSITGREYRKMMRKTTFVLGVSIGINIVLSVIVYILQAGPI